MIPLKFNHLLFSIGQYIIHHFIFWLMEMFLDTQENEQYSGKRTIRRMRRNHNQIMNFDSTIEQKSFFACRIFRFEMGFAIITLLFAIKNTTRDWRFNECSLFMVLLVILFANHKSINRKSCVCVYVQISLVESVVTNARISWANRHLFGYQQRIKERCIIIFFFVLFPFQHI